MCCQESNLDCYVDRRRIIIDCVIFNSPQFNTISSCYVKVIVEWNCYLVLHGISSYLVALSTLSKQIMYSFGVCLMGQLRWEVVGYVKTWFLLQRLSSASGGRKSPSPGSSVPNTGSLAWESTTPFKALGLEWRRGTHP